MARDGSSLRSLRTKRQWLRSGWSGEMLDSLGRCEYEATRTPGRCLFDVLETALGVELGALNEIIAKHLESCGDALEWVRRYGQFKKFTRRRRGGTAMGDVTTAIWAAQLRAGADRWLDAVLDVKLAAAATGRPIYVLLQHASLSGIVIDADADDGAGAASGTPQLLLCSPRLVVRDGDQEVTDVLLGETVAPECVPGDSIMLVYGGAHFRGTRLVSSRPKKRKG